MCEALHDGGLADTGFADQHRVVLGATLQHLDGAADLVVTTDHRIELALLGPLGHIDGKFLQRLALVLGIGVIDLLAAAHLLDGLLDQVLARARLLQQFTQLALVSEGRQYEQFAGDIGVLAVLRQFVSNIQQAPEIIGNMDVARHPLHLRQLVEQLAQLGAEQVDVYVCLHQQVTDRAALLIEQRRHQVGGFDELVITANRQALCLGQGLLELAGHFIHAHVKCL